MAEQPPPVEPDEPVEPDAPVEPDQRVLQAATAESPEPITPEFDELDEFDAQPRPARTARGVALVGVRLVAGAVGVGTAAIVIAAAALVPLPVLQSAAPSLLVTPVPSAQQLVCPGTFLRLGDEQGQDATSAAPVGRTTTRFDATDGAVDEVPLTGGGVSPGDPLRLGLPAGGEVSARLSGAQSQDVAASDFVGLAAASCAGSATESWLVGGSAAVGRTTVLSLANPSDVAATVSVEIFGEQGPVTAPGATGIIVQPQSQRVLSLSGFAPGLESPVVHVTSRGGQIVANLHQVTVRGLDAGGVDIIGAAAAPATDQVIPGLITSNSIVLRGALGASGFADLETVLRVLATGDEPGAATVTIQPDDGRPIDEPIGEDGTTRGATVTFDLVGGRVIDLPIENLKDGSYTVTVTADVPIVAGVRASTVIGEAPAADTAASRPVSSDFAWLPTATAFPTDTLVTIAEGPGAVLHLSNPTNTVVDVAIESLDGESLELRVPAGGAASIPVEAGESYLLGGFESLLGSVTFLSVEGDAQIAGYAVQPGAANATPLMIYPR